MRSLFVVFSLISLAALSGCAGMDAKECLAADWRAIGYEDGARGLGPDAFGERRRDCAEHGVTAEFEPYMTGRYEGLAYFCRPRNGYELGTRGYRYAGVCPGDLEADFLSAHAEGFGLYERHSALQRIGKRLNRLKKQSHEIEHLLAEQTALLLAPDLPAEERAALVIDLKQLAEQKVEVELRIRDLEVEQAEAKRDYEDYRRFVAARHGG